MKIFILLHAFFPRLSYVMERDPENYRLSIQELRSKIIASEPAAAGILTKYLDDQPGLLVKDELYSGRQTYIISDMGDQIRQQACGLLFGTKASVCSGLPWDRDRAEAKREFEPIAAQYVAKLKAGVAMDSNREAYLCRGEQTGGSSPSADARVGGLDSVFTRLIPQAYDRKIDLHESRMPYCDNGIRVLLDADVMGQASCYAHQTDSYGARVDARYNFFGAEPSDILEYSQRLGLPQFALKMQQYGENDADRKKRGVPWGSDPAPSAIQNEVMIRDLVPTRFVRGILVPRQEMKDILIAEFRKAGLIESREGVECVVLPGCVKPIDEFVYVGNVPRKEMWAKPTQR